MSGNPLLPDDFIRGMIRYRDRYPGYERSARIVLPVVVERRLVIRAVVDTGSPWCVIDPMIVRQVGIRMEYRPGERLLVRGVWYRGKFARMLLGLEAKRGESIDVDATVFVPELRPGEAWPHPNFIGLDGFLDRIRFAVDPSDNAFYFGPV